MFTRPWLIRPGANGVFYLFLFCSFPALGAQQPDLQAIIQKSVAATEEDFRLASLFNHKERDQTRDGSKTYQVTIIEGTPYQRLLAVNDKPLSPAQEQEEYKKQGQVERERRSESSQQRQERIAKYEKERQRDHAMMEQLTRAFNFTFVGQHKSSRIYGLCAARHASAWVSATGYGTQVLLGMQGELCVDTKTYQWVKVTAQAIHPVSIEGFLAQVEPGTQFELEKSLIADGIWQVSHFSMKSQAKVLYLFNRNSSENDTYFNYQRTANPRRSTAQLSTR